MRHGVEVPSELIPPVLCDVEWFYWDAFMELNTDRRDGVIPGAVIREYAKERSGSDPDILRKIIRVMDHAYIDHKNEKRDD